MRADWRFLIPWDEERAPIIAVGAHRRAAWMEEDGWAVAGGPADVIAVEAGPDLERALAAAKPRHLVIWWRPGRRSAGSSVWPPYRRARLEGYRTRAYLPLPGTQDPRTYLPVDGDDDAVAVVADWLGARLPAVAGPLARPAARTLCALGRRWAAVTVAEAAPGPESGTEEAQGDPVFVVTTSGYDEGSRAVRLRHWTGNDGRPRVEVEKFTNRPRYRTESEGEQEALATVRVDLPDRLAAAVPEPLGVDVRAGAVRVRESFLPGPTMAQALGRRSARSRSEQTLDRATAWLDDVYRATAEPFVWSADSTERWLEAPCRRLTEMDDSSDRLRSLVATVADRAHGGRAAVVLRHYDPGPWNLVMGPELGVIDWELRPPRPTDRRGLGLCDHLYLLCYWRHLVVGARSPADEWSVSGFTPPPTARRRWAVESARHRLLAIADELGVDRQVLPALWVHNWLEQAVFTSLRRADGRAGPALDYLRWAGPDGSALLAHWDQR